MSSKNKYKELKPNTKLTTGESELTFIREVKSQNIVELEYNGKIVRQTISVFKNDYELNRFRIIKN